MTRIKLCGLSRICDIEIANKIQPEYIGMVFAKKSKRYVSVEKAKALKELLDPKIKACGIFVDEDLEKIAKIANENIIDIIQIHGNEDNNYIQNLRNLVNKPIIKAYKIKNNCDIAEIEASLADYILLDSGAGTGEVFDWQIIRNIKREYFLAGGLNLENIAKALAELKPFAVDISSGIETNGFKDKDKMTAFTLAVRKENDYDK